jgi:16S rRNA G1207 methylase RsmC
MLLVANRFIRYEKMMENLFARTTLAVQDNRYYVFSAIK